MKKNKMILVLVASFLALHAMAGNWKNVALQSKVTHVQPMTGLVLWADNAANLYKTYGQSHALEYSYVAPCKVVTGCASDGAILYDWSYLEKILDAVKSRNHQAVLRFFYEYPGEAMVDANKGTTAVPAYIKAQSDYHETYVNTDDGDCYYADWSNAELKRFTKQFYVDFAARYGKDPRIAFVEVGFGHWSEYHIYNGKNTNIQFGKNFPTREYQKEFFLHLAQVMPIPWAISIDASASKYTDFAKDADLRALKFGLFDDSFMHEKHEISSGDGYNEKCWNTMGKDRWKTGVCGGEISYYTDSDQKNFTDVKGMYGHTWEEQAAKYHITFMIANDNPGKNKKKNAVRFKECSMASGYHFEVNTCQTDGASTKITITNTGVAPLYRDAYMAIGSVRSQQSLRGLLPGESKEIVVDAPLQVASDGSALVKPTIVSDYILDTQAIEYDSNLITTGIQMVRNAASQHPSSCYNLQGVKVPAGSKGLIIVKGKKYVNR